MKRQTRWWPGMVVWVGVVLGAGFVAPGCTNFDTTPIAVEHGTLGEEIVQILCERMAREAELDRGGDTVDVNGARWKPVCEGLESPPADAPPRLVALMQNRRRLATALDRTLPESMSDELGSFMGELLPFFDPPEERLPTQTRRLADFLMRLSANDEAIAALERLGTRRGYRPLRLGLGVARPVMAYPNFDEFADLSLELLLNGSASDEFDALSSALALEMATITPSDPTERSTLALTRDLMFTQDPLFSAGSTGYVLVRDERGIALPNTESGGLVAPFLDGDGDGLADIDSLGRFVGASGELLDLPAPFGVQDEGPVARDPSGRAIRSDGTRYFEYIDASTTMLAGLTAELSPWFTPESPTLLQIGRGMPVLLGPRVTLSQAYGAHSLSYDGFDTDNGPMFDAVHAIGELMLQDETVDAMVVGETLFRDHESAVAGVVRSARYLAVEGDAHPSAQLTENSIFWDDMIDIGRRFSQEPGMLEAVMRSLSDPGAGASGPLYASFMRNRDRITYNPADVNGPPLGLPLDEPVDRSAPDTFDNESVWQRTIALIEGLDGVTVCNREGSRLNIRVLGIPLSWPLFGTAGECDLIRIENAAEAFALTILGTYELELQSGLLTAVTDLADALGIDVDAALEEASGIDGLTRNPTPQAMARLIFWGLSDSSGVRSCTPGPGEEAGDCNSEFAGQMFSPVVDRHGNDVVERYHGTIFAWESPGFFDGMRALVEVLHRPGYTYDSGGNYYFGELLRTFNNHWASAGNTQTCTAPACNPGDPNHSYRSDIRSYEELLADGFDESGGALTQRLQQLNLALEAVEVRPGVDGVAALAAATEVMVDPDRNPALTNRRGLGMATVNDGSRMVPMTPIYLLTDALNAMDDAWLAEPDRRAEFLIGRRSMADQFLATETLGGGFRMGNQRARAMIFTSLPFMRERIEDHRTRGDLIEWATGLDERLADTMREPLFAALIYFLDALDEDPEARSALAELMGYLVGEASANDAFITMLYAFADALMVFDDDRNIVPLMNALAESLAPNVNEVITSGGAGLDIESSAVRDSLDLMQDIAEVDDERTLRRILQNAVALPGIGDPITPLETIIDVIAEVNRAIPNEGGGLRADDYRAVLGQTTDFMLDEGHGLERLNLVVQQRSCFPEAGVSCTTPGAVIDSRGTCYEGAQCTCSADLTFGCARP